MTTTTFKDLLNYALKINNLNVSKLATTIGVDRPFLQHVLAGRRSLGYDNFEKIMSLLNLPEHLTADLRLSFANEYFGEANFSVINNMLKLLNTMAQNEASSPLPLLDDNTVNISSLCESYSLSDTQSKFIATLYDMIKQEMNKSVPVIYTSYSFDIECIRMLFLHILRTSDSIVDYKHIIYQEPDCTENDIVNSYLYQFEFAGYGYNTYSSLSQYGISSSPLPYFVMTSEAIVYFSHDLNLFIIENKEDSISYMKSYIMKNIATSVPFSNFMHTKEAFTLFTSLPPHNATNELATYSYDLSPNLCFASYFDSNILSEAIPDTFEHKDFFVHGVSSFFNMYTKIPHSAVWHIDSLMNFTENDDVICDYHNVTFDILQISPQNKYKMLCALRHYAQEKVIRHFILNNQQSLPSYFHINCLNNSFVLGFNFRVYDIEHRQRYITTAVSQDPVIYKHLRNLAEYFEHSPYVYSTSPDYALAQIDNAIAYYKKKHNF